MALYFPIRCLLLCGSKNRASTRLKIAIFYCRQASNFKDEEGEGRVFSEFTSKLVNKKAKKWNHRFQFRKALLNNKTISTYKPLDKELPNSVEEINMLFRGAIEVCNNIAIIDLTQHCINHNIFPPLLLLLQALSVCGQNGDKDAIVKITELCEKIRPEILDENSHFQHYMAEAIWIKGNIVKSLQIFEQVYKENPFLRQRIRLTLKYLISDSIKNQSEATLVLLVKFCKTLVKDHSDFYPLVCIWEGAFLSEWFSDQCLAVELIDNNVSLLKAIKPRIPYVVHISLQSHRTEVIYRLTDILLKYDRKDQAAEVFFVLMDYWIKQGAIKECLEIVQWSVQNNIKLPAIQQMNFIDLLMNMKSADPLQNRNNKTSVVNKCQPTNYKF